MILLFLLIAAIPLIYFFPIAASICFGIIVSWLLWSVISFNDVSDDELRRLDAISEIADAGYSVEEAESIVDNKYYFSNPYSAKMMAGAATFWQLFCVIWLIYLLWSGCWWVGFSPVIVYLQSRIVRRIADPSSFLAVQVQLDEKRYGAKAIYESPSAYEVKKRFHAMHSAYDKMWGNK